MVSGMLTAVQDFTNDSFSARQDSGLNSLKLGHLQALLSECLKTQLTSYQRKEKNKKN